MSISYVISAIILVASGLALSGCQDNERTKTKTKSTDADVQNVPVVPPAPAAKELIVKTNVSSHEYRKLTPVANEIFEENMRRKTEQLERANAILANPSSTHKSEKNANIISHENMATNTEKNNSLTELDAVEQAIQAAAPALNDITEN